MFKILSSVVNGAKGAVTSSVKGASDVLSATINAVKNVTVSAFKETGDVLREGIQVPASIVKGTIEGLS